MKLRFLLKFSLVFLLLIFIGYVSVAQLSEITVRFANPVYDSQNLTYCVDVEFQSDTESQQLFGMNIRFFYDDDVLEFNSFGDFQGGYGPVSPNPPTITTAPASTSALYFALDGEVDFINGAIQFVNTSATPVIISKTDWTKLFNICFDIDPEAFATSKFNPSIIWDLEEIEGKGGYLTGDDGVVISLLAPDFSSESVASIERVAHHNWYYDGLAGYPFGYPGVHTPVAIDDFNSTNQGTPVTTNVIRNDYHMDGVMVLPTLKKGNDSNGLLLPSNGRLKVNHQKGEITYFPNNGFKGVETFEYEICDEKGQCDVALVTISVVSEYSNSIVDDKTAFDCNISPVVLYQNNPNPFKNETTIKFYIPESTTVILGVYDAVGKLVEEVVNMQMDEGEYEFELSGNSYKVGTYFYKLTTNETVLMKPMNLIK